MLLDSNILVYAINHASPKHKLAQRFIAENVSDLTIAHQNIFETLRVLTHPKFPSPMKTAQALEAVERITRTCQIIHPDEKTYHLTLLLIKKYKLSSDRIFDAYLAATALSNDISTIATDNTRDFKVFSEISVFNPFTV